MSKPFSKPPTDLTKRESKEKSNLKRTTSHLKSSSEKKFVSHRRAHQMERENCVAPAGVLKTNWASSRKKKKKRRKRKGFSIYIWELKLKSEIYGARRYAMLFAALCFSLLLFASLCFSLLLFPLFVLLVLFLRFNLQCFLFIYMLRNGH